MIRYLYLDVGGVAILDFSGTNRWETMFADLGISGETRMVFEGVWARHRHELSSTYDIERIIDEIRAETTLALPEPFSLNDEFVKRFTPNPAIHKPIRKAKERGIKVGLLTNMYIGMLEKIRAASLLPDMEFDAVVDSSVVKCKKPDPKIYRIAEKHAGVEGNEILFVDNLKENVDAALALGWQAFLYDPKEPERSSETLLQILDQSLS